MNPQYLVYDSPRNDTQLNNYNRTLITTWLANIDVSPCNSTHAVINYIAKYCSKAEQKSETFTDTAKAILPRVNANQGLTSFVAKFNHSFTRNPTYALITWREVTV